MTLTQAQEEYLKKIADIGLAEEEDIVARNMVINEEARAKNIEMGVIREGVIEEVVETPPVIEPLSLVEEPAP